MENIIRIGPEFYHKFKCKASACEHSCCMGWEIDIDDDTAEYYMSLSGEIGDVIRRNIMEDEEGYHFAMKNERCPLLEEDGLCIIIKNVGEDGLCDICDLHPRFFEYIGDYDLYGLGLSCEKVCELLLAEEDELKFVEIDADEDDLLFVEIDADEDEVSTKSVSDTATEVYNVGSENASERKLEKEKRLKRLNIYELVYLLYPNESRLLYSRKNEEIYGDESLNIAETVLQNKDIEHYKQILENYSLTEPIDEQWQEELAKMKYNISLKNHSTLLFDLRVSVGVVNRIFAYILFRQLENIKEYGLDRVIRFVIEACEFILLSEECFGNLQERIRRWSEQIEYSTENVGILMRYARAAGDKI